MSAHELIHSSRSNEWYTPPRFIDSARAVMGDIDLDPASCVSANEVVKAHHFYSIDDDGLSRDWNGRVWMNPPYGRKWPPLFVRKALAEYQRGNVSEAILLLNSNAVTNAWFKPLWDYPLCFAHGRVKFWGQSGKNSPTHGAVFVYLGVNSERFKTEFAQHGPVVRRYEGAA